MLQLRQSIKCFYIQITHIKMNKMVFITDLEAVKTVKNKDYTQYRKKLIDYTAMYIVKNYREIH